MAYFSNIGTKILSVAFAAVLGMFGLPVAFAYADEGESAEQAAAVESAAEETTPEATPEAASEASSTESQAAPAAASEGANAQAGTASETISTESKEDVEKAKKIAEATQAYERAASDAASAAGMLGGMPSLQAQLTPYFSELAQAAETLETTKAMREPLEEELEARLKTRESLLAGRELIDEQRAESLYRLALAERELALTGGVDLISVVVGTSEPTDAESVGYFLERVAATHATSKLKHEAMRDEIDERIAAMDKRIAELEAEIERVEELAQQAQKDLEGVVDAGNMAAFAIEKLASEARQEGKGAIEAVEKLDSAIEGVDDMKKAAAEWDLKSNGTRAQALAEAGQWYDAVDALVSLDGAISYGCGLDFALSEEEFVAKWGPAIDMFFGAQGAPLQGYGSEMARQAYAYKIDPRLCASVSIVESSGGRYCIKPHNAWGWGAADSDPYNLASGWSSWEEAIESWHRGMATSNTGLATTPSLTAMGDIYCSTPIWGSKVATLMEQISSYVKAQQVVLTF